MTPVQAKVLEKLPLEKNILVKSKTGTGKTLAFLIAALQSTQVLNSNGTEGFKIVIVAPTRELAIQIHEESKQLCQFSSLICHVLTGGADKRRQLAKLERERTDILVCTAGRMIDLLETVPKFADKMSSVKAFILDEVDRLLDIGMKADIETIASYMPTKRLNLLFSATLEGQTKSIAQNLCGEFDYIDCVDRTVSEVPLHIDQKCLLVPYRDYFNVLAKLILDHRAADPVSKIVVFFQTTKFTQFAADVFYRFEGLTVSSIHSGLRQQQREKVSQRFRESTGGILFTSDVSARGVDYPNVGLVIQMGMPSDRDTYIHRMGRTGRAGKDGKCILVLPPIEKPFLRQLNDMPIEVANVPKLFEAESKQMKQIEQGILYFHEEQRAKIFQAAGNGGNCCILSLMC
jgi:ATP-dependent RNA helicase MSS116